MCWRSHWWTCPRPAIPWPSLPLARRRVDPCLGPPHLGGSAHRNFQLLIVIIVIVIGFVIAIVIVIGTVIVIVIVITVIGVVISGHCSYYCYCYHCYCY